MDKVRNVNVKVINLMSEVNKTQFLVQYEQCKCNCRLNKNACYSMQKWNPKEYRSERK